MTSLILPMEVIEELEAEKESRRLQALVATRQHYDESTDSLVIQRTQDAEPALEFAQAMRCAHPRNGYSEDRAIRHVGEVPMVLVEDWINRGLIQGINDNAGIRKMLESSDYSRLRTVDKL